jgi:hypothetical protein
MKIDTIEGYQSFKQAQESLLMITNSISNMKNDELDEQDLQSWVWALSKRIESVEAMLTLFKEYRDQIENKQSIKNQTEEEVI